MSPEPYRLVILRSARKEMLGLSPKVSEQVERSIQLLLAAFQEGRRPQA